MTLSNFPNGFMGGLSVRGMPLIQTHTGNVYWVNNSSVLPDNGVSGSDGNPGTYTKPFSTLAYALSRCTANRGDIIFVMPGHAETIADAATLSLNVAGVAIIGLGMGSLRPTLTFTTSTSAVVPVTAANMSIQNFLFVADFADITTFMKATGTTTPTDFTVENCEFRDTSSILNALKVFTGNTTANSCDGFTFNNNKISSLGTTAGTTAIYLNSDTDRVTIKGNFGNWAVLNDTAAIFAGGANNMTNFDFGGNRLFRPNTSSTGGSFISGTGTGWTGHAYDNYMYQLDATAGIWIPTGTGLAFSENYSPITGAADKSGLINPAAV